MHEGLVAMQLSHDRIVATHVGSLPGGELSAAIPFAGAAKAAASATLVVAK